MPVFLSGSLLLTGSICTSQGITGATIYGVTAACAPTVFGTTAVCSPTVFGTTAVCSPTVFGTTAVCSPTVFGTTRVCSANLCATTTICGPSFVGGTMSGTTLYGSTVICGASICTTGNICAAGSITGSSILSTGQITAQTLVVSTISSSVTFSSGSNIFGNSTANTQTMTGSVNITGSLSVFTAGTSPEFQVVTGGTIKGNALTDVHNVTGSLRVTGSGTFSSTLSAGDIVTITSNLANSYALNLNGRNTTGNASTINFYNNAGSTRYGFIYIDSSSYEIGSISTSNIPLIFSTNQVERFRISSSGTASFTANALANSADAATINLKQNSTTANTGIYLERSGEQKGYYIYIGGSTDNLTFQRNNAGTKADVMSLTRDGCVSIGTACSISTLTIKSINDEGISLTRPSNGATNHLKISTTETGGDAYTVKYNTFNNEMIFNNYSGGGTGGNIIFRTTCVGAGSETVRFCINCHGIAVFTCQVGVGNNPFLTLGPSGGPGNSIHVHGGTGDAGLLLSTQNCGSGQYLGEIQFGTLGTASTQKKGATIASKMTAASNSTVTGNLEFYVTNAGTESLRMCIDAGGGVAVGCNVAARTHSGPGCRYNFTALNTPIQLEGICAGNGLLVIRDHTTGGSGVWLIDPNLGVICIASNIVATVGITYHGAGGVWCWCLTSNTVPRCLGYGFYSA